MIISAFLIAFSCFFEATMFGPKDLAKLQGGYLATGPVYHKRLQSISLLAAHLSDNQAKEYMWHGVGRRWRILHTCIHKTFSLFPLDCSRPLSDGKLVDICIFLHA